MEHQPRLVIVFEFDTINGGENSLLAVLPAIVQSGWNVVALWPGSDANQGMHQTLASRFDRLAIERRLLATHDDAGLRLSQEAYRDLLRQHLQNLHPQVVLCNSLATSRLCGPVTSAMSLRSIGYIRDIVNLSKKAIADLNQLDQIIAVSQATKDHHVRRGLVESNVQVLHNGVDVDLFHPDAAPAGFREQICQSLAIEPQASLVLYVGQIGLRKGMACLIDAFELLRSRCPRTHLLIVGQRHSQKQESVDYETMLQKRTASTALTGHVHWLGRRDDVPQLMSACDAMLHPARQEPLGRTLLEAAASGLPVVTTNVGGSPEIIGGICTCNLLCDIDDAAAMADRLAMLLGDDALRRRLSDELRMMAIARFHRDNCANAIIRTLQAVCDDPRRPI